MTDARTTDQQFTVLVRLQVHGSFAAASSEDQWLERKLILPFAPYVGLVIQDGKWTCSPLTQIVWDAKKNRFLCYVEGDKEIYNTRLHQREHRTLAKIVKEYTDDGWKQEQRA